MILSMLTMIRESRIVQYCLIADIYAWTSSISSTE